MVHVKGNGDYSEFLICSLCNPVEGGMSVWGDRYHFVSKETQRWWGAAPEEKRGRDGWMNVLRSCGAGPSGKGG